ncbi:MAG: acyltransferase family protein [Pseudomonadota bacterium]
MPQVFSWNRSASVGHIALVDGLRIVAALSVFLFHFRPQNVGYGYLGVDIFLAISGFLMASILVHKSRTVSEFSRFLYRRIMRIIFLAVTVGLITVAVFARRYGLPDFENLLGNFNYSLGFASNIFSIQAIDYFSQDIKYFPLLHYWTLSIELVAYIIIAVLYFAFERVRFLLLLSLCLLSAAAFAWFTLTANPNLQYYSNLSRTFQILGPFFLFLYFSYRQIWWISAGLTLAAFGLTLFVNIDFIHYLVTAATVMALNVVRFVGVRQGFATSILKYFGKLSFPFYLIHWPVLIYLGNSTAVSIGLLALTITCLLSVLLDQFDRLQQGFKYKSYASWAFPAGFTVGAFVVANFGLVSIHGNWLQEGPPRAQSFKQYKIDKTEIYRSGSCYLHGTMPAQQFDQAGCLDAPEYVETLLLLGDSNAAHFRYGLETVFPDKHILQMNSGVCTPLVDKVTSGANNRSCETLNAYLFGDMAEDVTPDTIILSARWRPENETDIRSSLIRLRTQWPAATFIVFGRSLYTNGEPPTKVMLAELPPAPTDADFDRIKTEMTRRYLPDSKLSSSLAIDEMMRTIAGDLANTRFVSIRDLQIDADTEFAVWTETDQPMYIDEGHFTEFGSVELMEKAAPQIERSLSSSEP